jgi:hypothetical protein
VIYDGNLEPESPGRVGLGPEMLVHPMRPEDVRGNQENHGAIVTGDAVRAPGDIREITRKRSSRSAPVVALGKPVAPAQ